MAYPRKPLNVKPLVVRPKEAERMLDTSHDRLYQLIASGDIQSYLDGSSRKILVSSIEAFIQRKLEASKGQYSRSPQPRRKASKEIVTP